MSVFAAAHLLFVGLLAFQLRARIAFLQSFRGGPGYLLSFGLTLFLVTWGDFLLYAILGWGLAYQACTWTTLVGSVLYFARSAPRGAPPLPASAARPSPRARLAALSPRHWNPWFLAFATFVLARFYFGVDEDDDGQIWVVFNFVDTAFHLSVANAFLEAPRFPPMDLDMPPFPLKYHFLADFSLAHLIRLGWSPLHAIWTMNFLSAAALVGSLWAVFERWLKLPARWVMLACFIFLFLNTGLINLLHYAAFKPSYFDTAHPFIGIIRYPYFNFESQLGNLFEPQRGLLFTMPVVLFVLHLLFGSDDSASPAAGTGMASRRIRLLAAFALICLLPLAHIVGFAVTSLAAVAALVLERRWFLAQYRRWLPFFAIGLCQIFYLLLWGPPPMAGYSGWDATASLPLDEFQSVPALLRRVVFWFFVNGDFFCWSLLLGGLAVWRGRSARASAAPGAVRLRSFVHGWRWYLAVCTALFLVINFYRYAYSWGDSNKFVLFLNLGLTLVIVLGAAQWLPSRHRRLSHALWAVLLVVTVAAPAWTFYRRVILYPAQNILFFHRHELAAGKWLRDAAGPADFVLTAAYTDSHFVSPLAGQPAIAGIYGDSNPNRRYGRGAMIRRVYEQADFALLPKLGVHYVCISRTERRVYQLDARWLARMQDGKGVVFHSGEPGEFESVYLFDARALANAANTPPPGVTASP